MTTYHHECKICHTPFEYGDIKVFRGDDESRFATTARQKRLLCLRRPPL